MNSRLVREITSKSNWAEIKSRFKYFSDEHIEVSSIPVVKSESWKKIKAETIINWWSAIEQRTIELSLSYRYMFITDITNCYGSIYTHSISWAMLGKDQAKKKKGKSSLGNLIDTYIQGMQYGQTNGIPQGSTLFDFIAEIVLGYVDRLVADRIKANGINCYKILRYRDDYRIFSNSKEEIESIILLLQSVLSEFNFQINGNKTILTENIVEDAIKPDKFHYITTIPAYNNKRSLFNSFQKELYYILNISKKYPNSGIVCRLMVNIARRLGNKDIKEDPKVLMAITTEIAICSPRIYQQALAIISVLITQLDSTEEKEQYVKLVFEKLMRLPNIGNIQVWW